MAKDPVTYWRAIEVQGIAETLILDFHEHLSEERLRYIFRSRAKENRGGATWAHVQLVSGLMAYLAQAHMLEQMDGPRPPAPEAASFYLMVLFVDHELSHISPAGLVCPRAMPRPYGCEFFDVVGDRLWNCSMRRPSKSLLFPPDPPAEQRARVH